MPYDPELDKKLKEWKCEETGLVLAIHRYGEGEAKLQIGPRILKKKDGSPRAPVKAGRLTIEDVLWLYDVIDEVKEDTKSVAVVNEAACKGCGMCLPVCPVNAVQLIGFTDGEIEAMIDAMSE